VHGQHGRFDFIMSDADHFRTQEWFAHVYANLLNSGGILIYHDVTNPQFPNLMRIYEDCVRNGHHHVLLNANSRKEERCDRGLLVIFKH
jgi:predicted O-methyltransferase YrrM